MSKKCGFSGLMFTIIITTLLMVLQPYLSSAQVGIYQEEVDSSSWTFLVYMSGDVPSSPLNWTADINEMEKGLLSQQIAAIALVDPEGLGDSRAYVISHDELDTPEIISEELTQLPFLPETGEANMGDSETLIGFATFILENYHMGGRFAVIFWGHGNGWYGVSQDREDILEPDEIVHALATIRDLLGRKVDLVVFDACNMGSLEVLSSLSDVALFSVCSEITLPSYGLPYDIILTRISIEPSMSTEDTARAFVEEYVKFGALISGMTSQAAVIDLEKLTNATASFDRFVQNCSLFMPIASEIFEHARNSSTEIDAGSTVDLMSYLSAVEKANQSPKRLARLAEESMETLSDAVVSNRVHFDPSDPDSPLSLSGISIFYPYEILPGSQYENTSDVSRSWADFLRKMHENDSLNTPDTNFNLTTEDRQFEDGLTDSVILHWDETQEIQLWEFEILAMPDDVLKSIEIVNDSNLSLIIDYLEIGAYNICIYGRGQEGEFRWYDIFESIDIMRRYSYMIDLSGIVGDGIAQLIIIDLKNEEQLLINVSGDMVTLTFDVPEPYLIGDKIIVELSVDGEFVARGLIVIGDDSDAAVSLGMEPELSSFTEFSSSILISSLLVFSFIKLMRVGEESGLSLKGLKNKKIAKLLSSLSSSQGIRKAEK